MDAKKRESEEEIIDRESKNRKKRGCVYLVDKAGRRVLSL
jgi:hypothetical protein